MITLESIKQKQDEVSAMISAFESYANDKISYPAINIDLQPGERNAGIVLGKDGNADYFLILLPEDKDDINWEYAGKWAKEQGGDLPTRREQVILFGNLKEELQESYYWSNEQHASDSGGAWCQDFDNGFQGTSRKSNGLRARAVRRLLIIQ